MRTHCREKGPHCKRRGTARGLLWFFLLLGLHDSTSWGRQGRQRGRPSPPRGRSPRSVRKFEECPPAMLVPGLRAAHDGRLRATVGRRSGDGPGDGRGGAIASAVWGSRTDPTTQKLAKSVPILFTSFWGSTKPRPRVVVGVTLGVKYESCEPSLVSPPSVSQTLTPQPPTSIHRRCPNAHAHARHHGRLCRRPASPVVLCSLMTIAFACFSSAHGTFVLRRFSFPEGST